MADVLRFDIAKDPKGNPITYGRVGDTDGLTRSVKVFEDGKPLDLTGYVITFEGNTSKYKTKVFDTGGVKLVDATKGEFTYTFPNMAFAVEGQYERAYFSFASAERRMTTGDFEIIVFGNSDIDAAEAETIITEYNRLVAELHALQEQAIDDMNGKFEDLETDISNLGNQLIDIQNEIDRVFEEFKSGNFWTKEESFNKEESSANVIAQITGTETAILKKEMLVNGVQGTGSRHANDLGTQNLMGALKSSRINYDVENNKLIILNGFDSTIINQTTLQAGTYTVSLKLFSKPSKASSISGYLKGVAVSEMGFLAIEKFNLNQIYTRSIVLTEDTEVMYRSWGNADAEIVEFEMKIEKGNYTKFSPAQEWVENGIVPFFDADYTDLLSEDGIVRSETDIVGRSAEMQFVFPVINTLETKYPYLFAGLSTTAEKIAKFKSIWKASTLVHTDRGGGMRRNVSPSYDYSFSCGYIIRGSNQAYLSSYNDAGSLKMSIDALTKNDLTGITSAGAWIFKIASGNNKNPDQTGTESNGETLAWVEVKDIRLIVELEVSGHTIIEEMIANYYVGAIATQSESETGTDNTKTMTPLRTKQQIDKRMATQSEAEAGTDSSKLMTPFATKQNIDKRIANQEEAEAGIADDKLMTPSTMNSFYLAKTQKRRQRWDEGLNWVAHRGNNTTYPENTIPAFLATKRHFGIETDIQVTSDGKWVVMHDATVDRTTNGTGAIASMTLAQFRALRIDTGSNLAVCTDAELTPPTLEEYLIACKTVNKVPVIEIKSYAYTDAHYTLLKDTLTRFGYDESNCVVISFDYAVLTKMRALYPNMELQYLVNSITSENINQAITLGVPGAISCSYSNASVTEANIKLIHAAGLKVAVWTVPDASFDKMIKLGVDYITTNSKSGNLRYGKLTFANGFTSNPDGGRVDSNYVEEINGTNLRVEFNVSDGVSTQNSAIATFPDWAIPMYRQFAQCGIRTSGGVSIATFDINGRLVPSAGTPGTIAVGLNWADRTSWAAGSTTYKLD